MQIQPPQALKTQLPLDPEIASFIKKSRKTIQAIIEKRDPRLLLIIGPCSIHSLEESMEYARKLKTLSERVFDSCFIVMRSYIEKSRTCDSWKGLVHDPHLNESYDIASGLHLCRSLLLELAQKKVPVATEFLSPLIAPYIEDLITWGSIGARTVSSQIHRLLASHLPMPIGFKNSIDGNIDSAIQGVCVARHRHQFLHLSDQGMISIAKSSGNPHAHIVLRGSLSGPNYDEKTVQLALDKLRKSELPPRLLIDCSHGNSGKQCFKQKEAFRDILRQIQRGNSHIFGMMIESHIEAGAQTIPNRLNELQKGVSITDSCLDFASTEELALQVAQSRPLSAHT